MIVTSQTMTSQGMMMKKMVREAVIREAVIREAVVREVLHQVELATNDTETMEAATPTAMILTMTIKGHRRHHPARPYELAVPFQWNSKFKSWQISILNNYGT